MSIDIKLYLIKFLKGSKLRDRFMLYFIILSVTPVLILGGMALYLLDLAHREDVSRLEIQLIDQKIEEIEKFFSDTLGILEIRVDFTQKSFIPLESQNFILRGLMSENPAFMEASFMDVGGLIVNDTPTIAGNETSRISRKAGELELITDPIRFANFSRLRKFSEPAAGKNFIGDVYYTISGPRTTLAAPVRNGNGDIIQVLSAEVKLSQIVRSIKSARLGTSGYLVLIDKEGSLISHRGVGNIDPGTDLLGVSRVREVLDGGTLDALGERDRYLSFFESVPVVGAGKQIPKIKWGVFAEWPISDADSVIQDIRKQIVLLVLFSILTVLVLAPLFVARLVMPIRKLEEGVSEIEKGKFEKEVKIDTGDELEDLGSAFNKMAKGLKRLKELQEEFVFIAAHDLRAPVTVIKGYLSMVLGGDTGPLNDKMKDYLGETNRANERLAKLVEDLLEVARSEAGRIEVKLIPTDIKEPAVETVRELKPLADEKSIVISYIGGEEGLPNALADSGRFKEALVNLVSNAIKYTPEKGEVKIFQEARGGEVITHVKDNGFGISKEAQKKLFEKFYRVQTKETRDITGTGLGLFIVKQLIEKMGGKIWFESEEGKGSTFSFSLKIAPNVIESDSHLSLRAKSDRSRTERGNLKT